MIIESFSIANVVVVTMKQMTLLSKADGIACYQKPMALLSEADGIDIIIIMKKLCILPRFYSCIMHKTL